MPSQAMVPITRADEELFATVLAASRLGRADAIIAHLRAGTEETRGGSLASFPYALSLVAQLHARLRAHAGDEQRAVAVSGEVIECLGDLLRDAPDHWLGRYLRIWMRITMIPPEHAASQGFVGDERARAAQDAEELLARQSRSTRQPWFACGYLLAARLAWKSSDRSPDRMRKLVSAAAAQPGRPFPFPALGGILCEAFTWYCDQPDTPERPVARHLRETLFPAQPAANATLRRAGR